MANKGDWGFGAESTGTEVAGRFRGIIWGRTCKYFDFTVLDCVFLFWYWWCLLCRVLWLLNGWL